MKKRILSMILAAAMVATMLVGCGAKEEASAGAGGKKVGVAMPTQSSERWINDGNNMKKQLEALGYEVDLQYAEDDVQAQVSQIENMIAAGVNCLVIASIDSSALVNVEKQAQEAGIPVIAYDRLLMDTDAVSYYATFDNKGVGTAIGKYIVDNAGLDPANPQTIELFMGSPDDNNAHMLYAGLMEQIQPYLDNGALVCKSGQLDFDSNCTLRWDQQTAMKRCEDLLTGAGYTDANWPMITGQDAELMATKHIISGKQTMSIAKDTRILAEKCVTMVQAVLEGAEPEINDTTTYNNNVIVVPSYLCTPVAVDKNNYKEVLVDTGYYTEAQLAE